MPEHPGMAPAQAGTVLGGSCLRLPASPRKRATRGGPLTSAARKLVEIAALAASMPEAARGYPPRAANRPPSQGRCSISVALTPLCEPCIGTRAPFSAHVPGQPLSGYNRPEPKLAPRHVSARQPSCPSVSVDTVSVAQRLCPAGLCPGTRIESDACAGPRVGLAHAWLAHVCTGTTVLAVREYGGKRGLPAFATRPW
jgi:hypothetical protein